MAAVDYPDQILRLASIKPVQPAMIASVLKTNSIMASAFLCELKDKGKLRITNMKIGSSPLYYLPDKPEHLESYVTSLNEKDQRTVEMLKAKKVVRENDLDPLSRVSVKSLRDFAYPLEVTYKDQTEIFWKYYLYSDKEVEPLIKELLTEGDPQEAPAAAPAQAAAETAPLPQPTMPAEKPVLEHRSRAKPVKTAQTTIPAHPEKPVADTVEALCASDPFLKSLMEFFNEQRIRIIEHTVIKKKSEHDFVLLVPSVVGSIAFYAKAKAKARILPADLSSAFVGGQLRKLPALLLAPGEMSRAAVDLQQDLKAVTFRRI